MYAPPGEQFAVADINRRIEKGEGELDKEAKENRGCLEDVDDVHGWKERRRRG